MSHPQRWFIESMDGTLCAAVSPALQAIIGFQLTTADPQRLVRFYTEALGFEAVCAPR